MTLRFSRGKNITDNRPRQIEVKDFAQFVAYLDDTRAPKKDGAGYVCGPLNGDGRRCAAGALPRKFIALDFDRIPPDLLPAVRMRLAAHRGCGWPTHSSTCDAPRERAIIELSREATRSECIKVGATLASDLADEFGAELLIDDSTFRGEQPTLFAPTGRQLARYFGEPLDVDKYLAARPATPEAAPAFARLQPGRQVAAPPIEAFRTGVGMHDTLARLVAQWASKGMDAETIRAAALGLLEHARPVRGARVDDIAGKELQRLIDGALRKYAPAELQGASIQFTEVPIADLAEARAQGQDWWWHGYVPAGHVTLLGGHGGAGKTTLAMMLMVCLASGIDFLGRATKAARVLFFSAEDPASLLRLRLARICQLFGVDPAEVATVMRVIDATELDAALFVERRIGGVRNGGPTPTYEALREYVAANQIDVLILDNASDLFDADEIARQLVRAFIRHLAHLVRERGGAVVLLAHVDKITSRAGRAASGESYSGTTQWHNSVRSRLFLLEKEPGQLELQHQKCNLGPRHPPLELVWPEGGLPGLTATAVSMPEAKHAPADDLRALLTLIVEFTGRSEWVSTKPESRPNVVRQLAGERGYPTHLQTREVFALLRDAERRGLLEREAYRGTDRKARERWRVTAAGQSVIDGAGPLFTGALSA